MFSSKASTIDQAVDMWMNEAGDYDGEFGKRARLRRASLTLTFQPPTLSTRTSLKSFGSQPPSWDAQSLTVLQYKA
jgi:hypothetical protein